MYNNVNNDVIINVMCKSHHNIQNGDIFRNQNSNNYMFVKLDKDNMALLKLENDYANTNIRVIPFTYQDKNDQHVKLDISANAYDHIDYHGEITDSIVYIILEKLNMPPYNSDITIYHACGHKDEIWIQGNNEFMRIKYVPYDNPHYDIRTYRQDSICYNPYNLFRVYNGCIKELYQ